MMCCAIAALFVAAMAALRGVAKPALNLLSRARWAATALAVIVTLAGGSALAAFQLDPVPPQNDFASFLMQHICAAQGVEAAPGRGNTKR